MSRRIASRYALALIGLADERKVLDKVAEDMHSIYDVLHDSRELRVVLRSPVVVIDKKLHILTEIFSKRLTPETMAFMTLLVKKGRSEYLLMTAEEFLAMLDERR